jgi:hypothetical protein
MKKHALHFLTQHYGGEELSRWMKNGVSGVPIKWTELGQTTWRFVEEA